MATARMDVGSATALGGRAAAFTACWMISVVTVVTAACGGSATPGGPGDAAEDSDAGDMPDGEAPTDLSSTDGFGTEDVAAGDTAPVEPTLPETACARLQPQDALTPFPDDCVLDVVLTLPESAWDTLRFETRTIADILLGTPGPDGTLEPNACLAQPPADIFSWHEANMFINGRAYPRVGVRKKGFLGSLSFEKPSLRIATDRFNGTQTIAGLNRLVFNNMQQDPGLINTCLAYRWLADAGLPAPRCAFAHVTVNGQALGLYAHVEAIAEPLLLRYFGTTRGALFEATLSDFRPEFRNTWERKDQAGPNALAAIDRVIGVLGELRDAGPAGTAAFVAALAAVIDLDAFYRHWAAEALVGHWDGYAGNLNNTWAFAPDADGRLRFIPWGMDAVFGSDPWPERAGVTPPGLYADGALAFRLWALPEGRAAFQAALRGLLDDHWNESVLVQRIDELETLLLPFLDDMETRTRFRQSLQQKRSFVLGRRAALAPLLAAEAPDWPYPEKEPFCWTGIGSVEGSFDTTWESSGWDPVNRRGAMLVVLGNQTIEPGNVTANARTEPNEDPRDLRERARVELLGLAAPGFIQAVAVVLPAMSVAAGVEVPLDWQAAEAFVGLFDTAAERFELQGLVVGGTLVFEDAFPMPGARIKGRLQSPVVRPP